MKNSPDFSEDMLSLLFAEMPNGFALHKIICNDTGQPVNFRFIAFNSAFEKLTGFCGDDVLGRTVLEIMPFIEKNWIDKFGRVALSGETLTFESYSQELERYYSVQAFCPLKGYFSLIFTDVSELIHSLNEKDTLFHELQGSLKHLKILQGLLTICSYCKKIKDDKGDWIQFETYIRERSEAEFSHGICRDCMKKHHPDAYKDLDNKK